MKRKYTHPDALNQVAEFHDMFGLPVLDNPEIPDKKRCQLRINLLTEELKELQEALDEDNIVEVADALCDLQYVLSGAILEFGMAAKFGELFDEVHSSNMSKTCSTEAEAEETLEHYARKDQEGKIIFKDEKYIVCRSSDHKILKSVNYKPADLEGILNSD